MLTRTPETAAIPYAPWPGEEDLAAAAAALAARLPEELAPLARLAYGYRWTWTRMRASLRTIGPRFCATRMLDDYLAGPYAG